MKDCQLFFKKIKKILKEKNKRITFLLLIPLFLFSLLLCLCSVNQSFEKNLAKNQILSLNLKFKAAPYPILNSVLGAKTEQSYPNISAEAAIVIDDNSKAILFAKNEKLRFSMASTTKIMTALTALDFFKLNDIITVRTNGIEGAVVGFKQGERIFFEDMLYAMLLPSGNDAAFAIAQNYETGEEEFIKKMNENAKKYNLFNTHYSDPAGLIDEGDYTTVEDLARLASIVVKNPVVSRIVSTQVRLIENVDETNKYKLVNLNQLLGRDGVDGIKTGFTDEAGGVLVTSRIKNNHRIIIVVMKSQDRFMDTRELLNFTSEINYNYTNQ